MDTYQQIVLYIAGTVFLLTMVLFWFISPKQSNVYPPVVSNCPTGWSVNEDGTCNIPTDGTNLGNLKGKGSIIYEISNADGTMSYTTTPPINGSKGNVLRDFYGNRILAYSTGKMNSHFPAGYDVKNPQFSVVDFNSLDWGKRGSVLCANYDWASKNNIVWEGVSTYNHCK
jgi:hypothetical protein